MSALDDFRRGHSFAVCVDSDGCAMDTMNIKHIRCFGPCMVAEWGLETWRDAILERWNVINLYSGTRGINRFKGLAMALREINERYTPVGVDGLVSGCVGDGGEGRGWKTISTINFASVAPFGKHCKDDVHEST